VNAFASQLNNFALAGPAKDAGDNALNPQLHENQQDASETTMLQADL
jgi:hypothetical protein